MLYCIHIYHKDHPYQVHFSTKAVKEAYVKEEFKYTAEARKWRYSCPIAQMKTALHELAKEQLKFATTRQYLGSKNDKYVLKLNGEAQPKEIA